MIRTTSKKAIENIKNYVMANYDPEGYDLPTYTTFPEIAKQILTVFMDEVGHWNGCRIGYQNAFESWCSGLPSILDTCYYYNRSAVDDLGKILEETEAEKAKYTELQAEKNLTWLMYREMTKAVYKNYHVNVWQLKEV